MDNKISAENHEKQEKIAPGFNTSTMIYVGHLIKKNKDSEDEENEELKDENEQDSENFKYFLEYEEGFKV